MKRGSNSSRTRRGSNSRALFSEENENIPVESQVSWTDELTLKFLMCILNEMEIGNWRANSLNRAGYTNVITEFASAEISITQPQLKNKFGRLKRDFTTWNQLKNFDTGLGTTTNGTIEASEDWWLARMAADSNVAKFRRQALKHEDIMYQIFQNTVPTNEFVWSVGSDNTNLRTPVHDVDSPDIDDTAESPEQPIREGSNPRSSGSKRKSSDSTELCEALNRFGTKERKTVSYIYTADQDQSTHERAVAILESMPDIVDASPLFFTAMRAFEKATKRMTWLSLRTDAARLGWLQLEMQLQQGSNPYN